MTKNKTMARTPPPGNLLPAGAEETTAAAGAEKKRRKDLALLGAFCLFLSSIEYMIPKPLPFMRIGIANLPLMLALDIFPFPAYLILVALKVFGQALITGTLFSYIFLFSLTGTTLSALTMYALRRLLGRRRLSFIGAGTAGAMMSNATQLGLAWLFIFRENVRFIAPPFLGAGMVTGIALGAFCEYFTGKSRWYAARLLEKTEAAP